MTPVGNLALVILAAGKGTRMRNNRSKVLHPLAGRSLIGHVVHVCDQSHADIVHVVLAPDMEDVATEVRRWRVDASIGIQKEPLGTGDAVKSALSYLPDQGTVIILFGDTPLVTDQTIASLKQERESTGAAIVVMSMKPPNPTGYGRLKFTENGDLAAIVEHAHADAELRQSAPCNSGVMAIDAALCRELVEAIPQQAQNGEYYLTDIVALAVQRGWRCRSLKVPFEQGHGVNSQAQLAQANQFYQSRRRLEFLANGVVMHAPDTVHFAFDTEIAAGTEIEPFVVFGPGVRIASGAKLRSFSHLEGVEVGTDAIIGPYARIRPGTFIGAGARIGNFVETKNAHIAPGTKANHLSYLGDCSVGQDSNIGAGTITCNYDGFNKSRTVIGERVFVGSNSALIAPVQLNDGVIIGAGSTITKDVPQDAISLSRPEQIIRPNAAPLLKVRLAKKNQRP